MRIETEPGIGELTEVGLAHTDHAGAGQQPYAWRIQACSADLPTGRGTGRGHGTRHIEKILPGQRNTIERAERLTLLPASGRRFGLATGTLVAHGNENVINLIGSMQRLLQSLNGIGTTLSEIIGQCAGIEGDCGSRGVHHRHNRPLKMYLLIKCTFNKGRIHANLMLVALWSNGV
ncbi:hypothetical protein ALO56_200001 [Pseudomonas viridiflava]|nr:hypothetical protein ALO56_200001 [Pseudomonas viridiflava]